MVNLHEGINYKFTNVIYVILHTMYFFDIGILGCVLTFLFHFSILQLY